tara:strand:+ start:8762 stop:8914 length:153 start_codon:yes stop_codon:yes gene_type:complete
MEDKKPLFKKPYDLKDVTILFSIVSLVLLISAYFGNSFYGVFQEYIKFGV